MMRSPVAGVDADAHGALQLALIGGHAVAASRDRAGERRDHPGRRVDAPDAAVLAVRDQQRAVGGEGDAERPVERRRRRLAPVADLAAGERCRW